MSKDIESIAAEFHRYKGNQKKVKYPEALWDKAINLCNDNNKEIVAKALGVSLDGLRRNIKKRKNNSSYTFKPINIEREIPAQIHINSSFPITIDFHGSSLELANFIRDLQKENVVC